jgi:CubicO group peptidase (beta-lactamase class C family)
MIYRILLILVPFFLQAGFFSWFDSISPRAKRAQDLLEGFEPLIEKALQDYQVPGVAVGIVVDGDIVWAKGFGYRDLEEKTLVDKETLFPIGSCTKAFTTFAMGNLVDEGFLEWDQPVIDVLPEFRLWDAYATTNLTIRDLLIHRTGLPRHEFVWYNSKITKNELLKRLRHLQPSFEIRSRYQYSNIMYLTAGLAMEQVTGLSWEDLIRKRILAPLEMTHTNFSIEDMKKSGNYASAYVEKKESLKKMPHRNLSLIGPAGSMNSNLEDMIHWMQMQLAGGVYKSQQLISPATLQEIHAPQIIVPGAPESKETLFCAYGIGWNVLSYRGNNYLSHDGISDGFTSVIGLLPGQNTGLIVFCNRNMTTFPRYLSFQLIDRLLELPFLPWLQDGVDAIRKNKESMKDSKPNQEAGKKSNPPTHPIEDYVGTYEHPGYGTLVVSLLDDKLEATYNDLTFVLNHLNYDVFTIAEERQDMILSFEGMKLHFVNHAHGEVGKVSVPFEPTGADIVFKKKTSAKHTDLAYLRQFTGAYEIYGYTVEIVVRDRSLIAIIPGQPNYELTPTVENEFIVKALTGSTVRFVMGLDKKVEEILLIHPYGAFSATPKR